MRKAKLVGFVLAPLLVLALVLSLAAMALPTAWAQSPSWSTAVNISDNPGESTEPAIAIDSNSGLHVVWGDRTPGNYEIYYATRSSDGSWSTPLIISPDDTIHSEYPDIAIDNSGNLHVVWQDKTPLGVTDIYYITKPPDGSWSATPVNISNNSGASRWPAIAVDSNDNLHVVWHDQTPGNYDIFYSISMDGGITWSAPLNITSDTHASYAADIAIDSDDNLHVVWQDYISGIREIYYITKPLSGSWSMPENISDNEGESIYPAIAIDNDDNLHVVWEDTTPGNYEIYYATKPSGGSWSTPANISNNDGSSTFPAIAIDSNNGLHVVWGDRTPGNYEIYYATKSSGGSWSTPANVSNNSNDSGRPAIAIDSGSNLNVVWDEQVAALNLEIYYASATIPTPPPPAVGGGLSGGAIAGIVIGSCACAGLIYYLVRRRRRAAG